LSDTWRRMSSLQLRQVPRQAQNLQGVHLTQLACCPRYQNLQGNHLTQVA
ncbi:hypothetical protein MKW94_006605, partial [Papaver nudicaule]|nr:hypothetical protein [Papaver nudicaule]